MVHKIRASLSPPVPHPHPELPGRGRQGNCLRGLDSAALWLVWVSESFKNYILLYFQSVTFLNRAPLWFFFLIVEFIIIFFFKEVSNQLLKDFNIRGHVKPLFFLCISQFQFLASYVFSFLNSLFGWSVSNTSKESNIICLLQSRSTGGKLLLVWQSPCFVHV